jgi:hypothetical protein
MNVEKLQEWSKWLDSKDGQKSLSDYAEKINNQNIIRQSQLNRAFEKFNYNSFAELIEKIKLKYESDGYYWYWMKNGYEPPKPLYFFLLEYAEMFGREATKKEYKEFSNMFTTSMFVCNDYFFSRMDGQGSVVHIWKSGSSCR